MCVQVYCTYFRKSTHVPLFNKETSFWKRAQQKGRCAEDERYQLPLKNKYKEAKKDGVL